jgi:tetratricopeptide (TPR) repeat protein
MVTICEAIFAPDRVLKLHIANGDIVGMNALFILALVFQSALTVANNVEDLINQGIAAMEREDGEAALQVFQSALNLAPTNVTCLEAVGAAHAMAGNSLVAIEHYIHAAKLEPDSGDQWFTVGNALAASQRLGEAEAALSRALAVARPAQGDLIGAVAHDLGIVLSNSKRPGEAEVMLKKAAHHLPEALETAFQLGNSWLQYQSATLMLLMHSPQH